MAVFPINVLPLALRTGTMREERPLRLGHHERGERPTSARDADGGEDTAACFVRGGERGAADGMMKIRGALATKRPTIWALRQWDAGSRMLFLLSQGGDHSLLLVFYDVKRTNS